MHLLTQGKAFMALVPAVSRSFPSSPFSSLSRDWGGVRHFHWPSWRHRETARAGRWKGRRGWDDGWEVGRKNPAGV